MSTAGLYVTIHTGGGVYKQWRLYLDGPSPTQKIIYQVRGSTHRYRFETRTEDYRKSEDLLESIFLCDVELEKFGLVDKFARSVVVRNRGAGWNCQDFVLELLERLEEEGVLDGSEEGYRNAVGVVRGKVEGLVERGEVEGSISL